LKEQNIGNNLMIPEIHKLDKETLISKLAEFFKLQEGIEFAYLFGSMARIIEGL
jgi:predicted nucleotidyltransferase